MSDEHNYQGAMADLDELVRVARDKSPAVLRDFLMCNYPEEMGLSKEQHKTYLDNPASLSLQGGGNRGEQ